MLVYRDAENGVVYGVVCATYELRFFYGWWWDKQTERRNVAKNGWAGLKTETV